jgi:hypothetical protein
MGLHGDPSPFDPIALVPAICLNAGKHAIRLHGLNRSILSRGRCVAVLALMRQRNGPVPIEATGPKLLCPEMFTIGTCSQYREKRALGKSP